MNPQRIQPENLGYVMHALLGKHFMVFENLLYDSLGGMTGDYTGGLWTGYYDPEHKVFFMVPPQGPHNGQYTLQVPGNGFEGTMGAEAAGIVASIVAWNQLLWMTREPGFNDMLHALRHYALDHPENKTILQAID